MITYTMKNKKQLEVIKKVENIRKKNILINNSITKANYLVKLNDELKILNFHEALSVSYTHLTLPTKA